MREDWIEVKLEDLLDYIQPTNYIVDSTKYNYDYKTPVLTAGKSFILGYTNEEHNIFEQIPAIIFDDFTTASKYVNFHFKVKSSAMKILVPTYKWVNLKYVYYYMQVIQTNTDTHKRYWISIYSKLFIKLPPLVEQRAIVSKIEELFSELDNGIENLNKAKDKLEIYRKAVLKKAFEGELTKEWRSENKNLYFNDDKFKKLHDNREKEYLDKIKIWNNKVDKWLSNGSFGRKPKKPRRLDVSTFDSYAVKFKTPIGWKKCQLADVISDLTDYHANGSYKILKENVVLKDTFDYAVMIRATNFEKEDFISDLKYIDENAYKFLSKTKLYGGEILIGKIGNAGKVYFMPKIKMKASLAMNLFAIRTNFILSKYLYYHLKNFDQEEEIKSYIKGVGTPTIDKISIRSIHINICSYEEQKLIVKEIEYRLSFCDNILENIEEALKKAGALRQSILKKAFEGELLSEAELDQCRKSPDWEPAEKLLERIKEMK